MPRICRGAMTPGPQQRAPGSWPHRRVPHEPCRGDPGCAHCPGTANAPWASRRGPASGLGADRWRPSRRLRRGRAGLPPQIRSLQPKVRCSRKRIIHGWAMASKKPRMSAFFLSDHIERYPRPFCQSAAKFVVSSETFASNDRFAGQNGFLSKISVQHNTAARKAVTKCRGAPVHRPEIPASGPPRRLWRASEAARPRGCSENLPNNPTEDGWKIRPRLCRLSMF
jgi:hypothetical protein